MSFARSMSPVPLHTRVITLRLRWSRPGEVIVEGRLMDIRKRSIVPLGASLRGPGVVHDMVTVMRVDPAEMRILAVEPSMNAYPYVPSEHTGGEDCTGRMADVQSLAGMSLNDSYADGVRSLIGGPRGCFHIFTLLRVSGPAVVSALGDDYVQARLAAPPASQPTPGEVLWARCVTVDAFKGDGLAVQLHGTLTDTYQRGGPPESGGGDEVLERGSEVMADLATGFPEMTVLTALGRRRALLPGFGQAESWQPVPEMEQLSNLSIRKGFTSHVHEALDDPDGVRAESQLIFMMAPVLMQSLPGLLEEMEIRAGGGGGSVTGTALNSCHMWRADGPLNRRVVTGAREDS